MCDRCHVNAMSTKVSQSMGVTTRSDGEANGKSQGVRNSDARCRLTQVK